MRVISGVLLLLTLLFAAPMSAQQIELSKQVKGQLPPGNGGVGLDASTANGCLKYVAGVPSVSMSNCGGSFATLTSGTNTTAAFLIGNGASLGPTGTGMVTASTLTPSGVTAGSYNIGGQIVVVNAGGQITAIGNPFTAAISSCSACGAFEVGQATTNPATFTFSYANGTVASASISDGSHTVTLSTPGNGSLAYQYCKVSDGVTSVTFTLAATATNGQSAGAQNGVSCSPRTFAGVGPSGATGATASGRTDNNAALVGVTGTLTSPGLNNQSTYGPFAPSGQVIYLVMTGGAHTFKDQNNVSFPMTVTPITFVNRYGASPSNEYLYSSGVLASAYTLTVVN